MFVLGLVLRIELILEIALGKQPRELTKLQPIDERLALANQWDACAVRLIDGTLVPSTEASVDVCIDVGCRNPTLMVGRRPIECREHGVSEHGELRTFVGRLLRSRRRENRHVLAKKGQQES